MIQFNVRFSKDWATLSKVPEGYGKKGFLGRLPSVLAKRPREFVEDFTNCYDFATGSNTITIEKHKNGTHVVGTVTFGNRNGKKYAGPDEVVTKTKVLINRQNGLGIRLCFIPDEWIGKRVNIG